MITRAPGDCARAADRETAVVLTCPERPNGARARALLTDDPTVWLSQVRSARGPLYIPMAWYPAST